MTRKGMGLVEFRANLDDISRLKKQGYGKKHVHEILAGKITLSYAQFTRIWSQELGENPKKPTKPQPKSVAPSPSRDIFRAEPKVLHNPSMTPEREKELF